MQNLHNKEYAAKFFGVGWRTIDRWREEGSYGVKLDCYVFGRVVRFSDNQLEMFAMKVKEARAKMSKSRAKSLSTSPPAGKI